MRATLVLILACLAWTSLPAFARYNFTFAFQVYGEDGVQFVDSNGSLYDGLNVVAEVEARDLTENPVRFRFRYPKSVTTIKDGKKSTVVYTHLLLDLSEFDREILDMIADKERLLVLSGSMDGQQIQYLDVLEKAKKMASLVPLADLNVHLPQAYVLTGKVELPPLSLSQLESNQAIMTDIRRIEMHSVRRKNKKLEISPNLTTLPVEYLVDGYRVNYADPQLHEYFDTLAKIDDIRAKMMSARMASHPQFADRVKTNVIPFPVFARTCEVILLSPSRTRKE